MDSRSASNSATPPTAGSPESAKKSARRKSTVQPMPRAQKPKGELLTVEEKKANHIASEQKRRQAIREGFERITKIVPNLDKSQGRSEAIVLNKTVAFLKNLIAEGKELELRCNELQIVTPPPAGMSKEKVKKEESPV
ncbi:basic helix-loop-helix transcription factor Yas1p [Yarrowia lipolytica]|jgi:heteromeric Ino2p/Ino4p transcription factor|uniref:YALI0C02387p n=2 Tax=Yarrowia lipolytica TaxID=4952 RepID=F2Z5Y4_YARLI|nr:YALI0C02387p [Yarrowia lipolytica CLIB122]AOW02235.1 hypothetical protein YALI1_C03349g [Yarrowia lipolytica]KAB8283557.1 basic helix-loop-helix transcription factor Yas1p [Yarrowia lipolytica]KAE8172054.1 basic helix-loop-helix transcription factor Yas1p [Yarrowia lipolytica]KAJ8052974.1 basic helix-loop-helix transcription factor Yas1p [Yarrowia lipolytica]QNP96388.1 Basic helix-loop-helix transcription factor Yas1p [Yarrowia lipolytica]|eukprot:XP_501357.1 YALI0C02387p [Yarrowia lipolytica CLIB122]